MQLVKAKVQNTHFGIALLVGIVSDLLDAAGVGLVPGIGDVFDLITMGILYKLLGPIALLGAVELLPVAVTDALPMFTITVILAWLYKGRKSLLR